MAAARSADRFANAGVSGPQSARIRCGWRTSIAWEAPLTRLQQSLSGPVAGAIAIIALVAIGVTLVFGGEWNEFARRAVYAVCAIAFIISAAALLGGLFAVGAAVV